MRGRGPEWPLPPVLLAGRRVDRLRHADRAQEDLRDGRVADHPRRRSTAAAAPRGGPTARIVFSPRSSRASMRISSNGGQAEPLTTLDKAKDERTHRWPQWLPGGKAVLFTSQSGDTSTFDTGDDRGGADGHRGAKGRPPRRLLRPLRADRPRPLRAPGTLFALPFDAGQDAGDRLGDARPRGPRDEPRAKARPSTASRTTACWPTSTTWSTISPFTIVSVDRQGRSEPLWKEPGIYGTPRLSPDGRRLAVSVQRDENWNIWVYDLDRDVATRVTFGQRYDADSVWSPDGPLDRLRVRGGRQGRGLSQAGRRNGRRRGAARARASSPSRRPTPGRRTART